MSRFREIKQIFYHSETSQGFFNSSTPSQVQKMSHQMVNGGGKMDKADLNGCPNVVVLNDGHVSSQLHQVKKISLVHKLFSITTVFSLV